MLAVDNNLLENLLCKSSLGQSGCVKSIFDNASSPYNLVNYIVTLFIMILLNCKKSGGGIGWCKHLKGDHSILMQSPLENSIRKLVMILIKIKTENKYLQMLAQIYSMGLILMRHLVNH